MSANPKSLEQQALDDLARAQALGKSFDFLLKEILDTPTKPKLPPDHPRAVFTVLEHTLEDEGCTVICRYRIENPNWWREGDDPDVTIIRCWIDFGGLDQIEVTDPTRKFSTKKLQGFAENIVQELLAGGRS